ncbi:hypothetical protein [Tuwongella immobilis]|uniref:Uncharacterized protein n=1 Tax=Tuwongella immobilis TaxID=692036 RepID=A0A6C2YX17_9BACT|nr:hypothetical protein [Tuwongella immobilis]VIP05439.1 unnamed protein product [Tuwongella immobilis]VTS08234.1 unnamed protein product [Tuwongella immobilis]
MDTSKPSPTAKPNLTPEVPPTPIDAAVDWNDRLAFQIWTILFLSTLCFGLLHYLMLFIRS